MTIEITPAELNIYRSKPVLSPKAHYLSIAEMKPVFTAEVSGLPLRDADTFGMYAIPYSGGTGDMNNVRSGMTVCFGTTAGASDIGTSRIRYNRLDNDYIYIAETAFADLPVTIGHHITVMRDFRPQLVLPRGKALKINNADYTNAIDLYMDYDLAYSGQNNALPPMINVTRSATTELAPKPSGWVDSGQVYRTLTLSAALSFGFDGATIASVTWDVQDGVITVGDANALTIEAQFPVGFRWIGVSATDSKGKSSERFVPIWVHDATYPPITRFHYTRDHTMEFREMDLDFFGQDMDESIIPEGVAVNYWKELYHPIVPETYRDQFLGWVTTDTSIFKKYDERSSLTLRGLAGWLDEFKPLHQRISIPESGKPETWFTMPNITLDKLVWYVLKNFTTAPMIGNFWLSGKSDPLKALDTTGSSIWGQVKYIVSGYYGVAGCDSQNGIWLRQHRSYLQPHERALTSSLIDIDNNDWLDENPLTINRVYNQPVGYVFGAGSAFINGDNKQFASAAPGRTPSREVDTPEAPFQNLPDTNSQTILNWYTGQHYANLNNERQSVDVELLYPIDAIEPAWAGYIRVTATDSNTGVELNLDEFMITEINNAMWTLESREITNWNLEGVTMGVLGEWMEVVEDTIKPPDSLPPFELYPFPNWGLFDGEGLRKGLKNLAAVYSDGTIAITTDFESVSPSWITFPSLAGENCLQWCYDARSAANDARGWIVTETSIYYVTSIGEGRTPYASLVHTFPNASTARNIDASYLRDTGLIVGVASAYGNRVAVTVSTNGGVTWGAEINVSSAGEVGNYPPAMRISQQTQGRMWSGSIYNIPDLLNCVYQSNNNGSSWTSITRLLDDDGLAGGLTVPPHNEDILYWGDFSGNNSTPISPPNTNRTMRSAFSGGTPFDISPRVSGTPYASDPRRGRFTMSVSPHNPSALLMCGCNYNFTNNGVFYITNASTATSSANVTFNTIVPPSTNVPYVRCALPDDNTLYLWGLNDAIAYSENAGATLEDKKGNLMVVAEIIGVTGF